jgi:hypothetical protein
MKLLRCLLSAVFLVSAGMSLRAQVVIQEFLASNASGILDSDGDRSDWIELLNPGPTAVALAGWSLTDNPAIPRKWVFPPVTLNAGAYLLVWASGKDRTNPAAALHANFSLSVSGEYLALFPPEGGVPATEFAPEYPAQKADVSYGFRAGQRFFFSPPTPLAANVGGVGDFVADTKFSHDRGLYEAPFDLRITSDTPGVTIRYTTNGAPPTLSVGLTYTAPILVNRSVVVRAAAFKAGSQPSNVDTHTYLFLSDVIRQSANGAVPWSEWPAPGSQSQTYNYGMDPRVVDAPAYRDQIIPALRALPTFSVVTALSNLFHPAQGIFSNPGQDGRPWERPASLELIFPDGRKGFQIDCGIRIRGGYSRSTGNPKHAFRFFFREEYGEGKLKFPLHEGGTDEFDALDLRTFQNYSWSFDPGDGTRAVFIRDVFSRDAQLAMGQQGERGNYYHLYLDGVYWGIFNSCERPEANYGATYFGGAAEDYDVVKVEAGPYALNATDGTMAAWTRLYNLVKGVTPSTANAVYQRVQGLNLDGTPNPTYENLLEIDNLIDYLLVIVYGGNLDAPISNFLGNDRPNNWYGLRNRAGVAGGFRFISHDAEHTLLDVNQDRVGPFNAGNDSVTYSNPQYVWQRLWQSPEFRVRIADRVQRHFFNGGPLTVAAAQARFAQRTNQLHLPVVAESARWGDSKSGTPFTRDGQWLPAVRGILNNYLPARGNVVLGQLRSRGLFPNVVAPTLSRFGGVVPAGSTITISGPAGAQVLYTANGEDPRLFGGGENPNARLASVPLVIQGPVTVRTRSRRLTPTNEWSGLVETEFFVAQDFTPLQLTEIHYRPAADPAELRDRDEFEFVELKNAGNAPLDLSGVRFTEGIQFDFPRGTVLQPGKFLVLVENPVAFTNRYPGRIPFGQYSGKLADNGERLLLSGPDGAPLLDVTYDQAPPWPESPDGLGFSLVPVNGERNPNPNLAANWRPSSVLGGSPGADDVGGTIPPVVVNEVLTHTDLPQVDAVELYNPGTTPVDLSGWYLTDDRSVPKRYRLPAGTVLPAGGYRVVDETQFADPGLGTNAFRLSSHGDGVFLFSADAAGELTGYSEGTRFDAAANGVSFGRHTNSVGEVEFVAQAALTLGAPNAGPRLGSVVFVELFYSPPAGELAYVEVRNVSATDLPLFDPLFPTNRWRISGLDFEFPPGVVLPPQGLAVITEATPERFRAQYGVPGSVPVFSTVSGQFQRNGERLELLRPDAPDLVLQPDGSTEVVVPRIVVDAVRYDDQLPWPLDAAGRGASLERRLPLAYGNDPAAWRAPLDGPTPGQEAGSNRPPRVDAGSDRELSGTVFPLSISLAGGVRDDGLPGLPAVLSVQWSQTGGPAGAVFTDSSRSNATVAVPGQVIYTFQLQASDGERQVSDEVRVTVGRPSAQRTWVAFGSVWRYSDTGQDLGTAWRQPGFNDSGWAAGPARLGLGGDGEVTTVNGGPSNARTPTIYFRHRFQVPSARSVLSLALQLIRDDGAVVYLNGTEVFRNNMGEGDPSFGQFASAVVGGSDETTPIAAVLSPAGLVDGENVLAVEVHQVNSSSSDLGLDLELTGLASGVNASPQAQAGADVTVTLPATAPLRATFVDDGLPQPPGVPAFGWSKVSGPGTVQFTPPNLPLTVAAFSEAGDYVLRFLVNDGEFSVADTVAVQVLPAPAPAPVIQAVQGDPVTLRFNAAAGRAYQVRFRTSLADGGWVLLSDVPAGAARVVDVPEVGVAEAQRFYQLVLLP